MAKGTLAARLRNELAAIGKDYREVGRIAIYGRKKKKAKRKTAAKRRRAKATAMAKKAGARKGTRKTKRSRHK